MYARVRACVVCVCVWGGSDADLTPPASPCPPPGVPPPCRLPLEATCLQEVKVAVLIHQEFAGARTARWGWGGVGWGGGRIPLSGPLCPLPPSPTHSRSQPPPPPPVVAHRLAERNCLLAHGSAQLGRGKGGGCLLDDLLVAPLQPRRGAWVRGSSGGRVLGSGEGHDRRQRRWEQWRLQAWTRLDGALAFWKVNHVPVLVTQHLCGRCMRSSGWAEVAAGACCCPPRWPHWQPASCLLPAPAPLSRRPPGSQCAAAARCTSL